MTWPLVDALVFAGVLVHVAALAEPMSRATGLFVDPSILVHAAVLAAAAMLFKPALLGPPLLGPTLLAELMILDTAVGAARGGIARTALIGLAHRVDQARQAHAVLDGRVEFETQGRRMADHQRA